ncbi:unnamed protein product [[Candida] boidinii]|nr:unnamed protein product [[Candida] boidinii]
MKVPENRFPGTTRQEYAEHFAKVYLSMFGLMHTRNTKVGDDFVRGVSGGERKRVSITEAALCCSRIQCWDNATRGLDSASAENFVQCLKLSCDVLNTTSIVSIYQCSQRAYNLFNKVILLYEGRQIFFGSTRKAKAFFENLGFECPERQTTADFLTSLSSPTERKAKKGWELKVPRSPAEFEKCWKDSNEYKELIGEIDKRIDLVEKNKAELAQTIETSHRASQANHTKKNTPYTVSFNMQIKYLTMRAFQRLRNNLSLPIFTVFCNLLMALINGSIFYNMSSTTASLYHRGACIFFACLFNSFMSILEVFALYESRSIVEKHKQYGLYHPSAEAFASIVSEIPTKAVTSLAFNLPLYFLANLRRTPGAFFFYLLMGVTSTFVMSHLFRTIGACTKSLSQAMTPSSLVLLGLSMYVGFVVPTTNMLGWSRWINYLDPLAYLFESMMVNEFYGLRIHCAEYIPSSSIYDLVGPMNKVCNAVGSQLGADYINGTTYLKISFNYSHGHKWRNWGIALGFMFFFLGTYLVAVEYNPSSRQHGEKLIFMKSTLKKIEKQRKEKTYGAGDEEAHIGDNAAEKPPSLIESSNEETTYATTKKASDSNSSSDDEANIFHWKNVCYDIPYMGGTRRLLTNVDGWVKPGTLTALMGSSGAGKTTLLDVLAERTTMGVITGDMLVNGKPRDLSFQRCTGYVQQQDLHLQTSTVREALLFSAVLRQPKSVSFEEKKQNVEEIIATLEMEKYADAIVGVPGEGLNVEQRKRLTIGVELAAKPSLLLFLDEPTSGLDSQTAWSILQLIKKLSNQGQAILCTIHQPSAMLFSQFDNLLLLKPGGQTIYFGPVGQDAKTLINYFEKNGSIKCGEEENPAEWMLKATATSGEDSDRSKDWHKIWSDSEERKKVVEELETMAKELIQKPAMRVENPESSFAAPLVTQYMVVTKRVFQQYWRSPSYIWNKVTLVVFSCLFNGFTFFKADNTIQGLQNQMFSVFLFTVMFATLIEQMLPHFVSQRELYEARERPSKTFSWFAFITAQITVEIPYMMFVGTLSFFCWYYPVGLYHNATFTDTVHERGATMWAFIIIFFLFTSTLGQASIAGIEIEQNAANIATVLFALSLAFCGVLVTKEGLPGFWIFMYRVSPFTYWIAGVLTTGLGDSPVECSDHEFVEFETFPLLTCGEYMAPFIDVIGGYLKDANSTDICTYCKMSNTNAFLTSISAFKDQKWRNFGIFWVYIVVNIAATILIYYLFRVPKKNDFFKIYFGKVYSLIGILKRRRQKRHEKIRKIIDDSGIVESWRERRRRQKDLFKANI